MTFANASSFFRFVLTSGQCGQRLGELIRKGGAPTATTYIKPHKQAAKRTAIQSLKDRFDYGLNPEKLGAVSSYLCDPETATPSLCW